MDHLQKATQIIAASVLSSSKFDVADLDKRAIDHLKLAFGRDELMMDIIGCVAPLMLYAMKQQVDAVAAGEWEHLSLARPSKSANKRTK